MRRALAAIGVSALLCTTVGTGLAPAAVAAPPGPDQDARGGPFVSQEFRPGRSAAARDLPRGNGRDRSQPESPETGGPQPGAPGVPDPVLQDGTSSAAGEAPVNDDLTAPLVDFAGQTRGQSPPDTVGDVGPDHYVQMINATFQIWDKQGTSLAGPTNIRDLWTSDGTTNHAGCDTQNAGDPIVLYDQTVDRWMLSQFTSPINAPFDMCIAYSQTSDPTGPYHLYALRLPASHDYMKYGIWPDGLYMSTFEGGTLGAYAIDRAAMISGSPTTFQYFGGLSSAGRVRMFPSDWDGVNPPVAGEPNHFLLSRDADNGQGGAQDAISMYDFHVDWTTPANSTFGLAATLPVAPFDIDVGCVDNSAQGVGRDCISTGPVPLNASKTTVDALPGRLMHRVQYRNFGPHQSMVVVQASVDADGANRVGTRWYELRRTGAGPWTVHQQGTYAPGTADRWMGSIAMDRQGNIAVGYSIVDTRRGDGTTLFPSVGYTGRLASAPLGSLPEPEQLLVTGTTPQTNTPRWGDYSSMNVDPTDDCTFWYTQQHSGNAQTHIGSFRFASCSAANLSISKVDDPDPVLAGESLTYTLDVRNAGPQTAEDVVVTDVLPAGVQLRSTSPACTQAPPGTLSCPVGTLLPGQSTTVALRVDVPRDLLGDDTSRVITNTASVAAAAQGDPDPSDNSTTETTTVRAQSDLSVSKVCKPDEPASAGTEGFCDIHVDAGGPSDARDVVLTDVLTSQTPFTVTSVTATPGGTCSPTTAGPTTSVTVTCQLGTEPAGGRTTVRVSLSASDVAQVNDLASVDSATPDPVSSNDTASGRVLFVGSADVSVLKTGPATAVAGGPLQYLLTVRNDGPSTARSVQLTDRSPHGVTFSTVSTSAGTCTISQPDDRTLTCGLGDLAPGSTVEVVLDALVAPSTPPGTVLFNEAVVSSATADPDNSDNRSGARTTVTASADLSLTKAGSPSPVVAGERLTYTLTVSNAGPSTAREVIVTDDLPAGTTFVGGVDAGGTTVCTLVQSTRVVCALGSLEPGASRSAFLTVLVGPSVPHGATLTNSATVSSATPDPDPSDDTAVTSTPVTASADLWLDKQAVRRSGNPSPVLVYSLVVHNDEGCETDAQSTETPTCGDGGPSDAQGITVVDRLPLDPKKMVVQYVSPQCTYVKSTHTVTCSAATVPAGASVPFVIEVQVNGSVGTVLNRASVTSTTADPRPANGENAASIVMKGGTGAK